MREPKIRETMNFIEMNLRYMAQEGKAAGYRQAEYLYFTQVEDLEGLLDTAVKERKRLEEERTRMGKEVSIMVREEMRKVCKEREVEIRKIVVEELRRESKVWDGKVRGLLREEMRKVLEGRDIRVREMVSEVAGKGGEESGEKGEDAEFPPFDRMWWFVEGLGGHTPRPSAKLRPRCP